MVAVKRRNQRKLIVTAIVATCASGCVTRVEHEQLKADHAKAIEQAHAAIRACEERARAGGAPPTSPRKGVMMTSVVVAAQAIRPGERVTIDTINQRLIPEEFVTSSVVKPNNIDGVLNKRINVALQRGDVILWSFFADQ